MNKTLLDDIIKDRGIKYNHVADKLGISPQGLSKKRNGDIPFTIREVNIIKGLLGLTNAERDKIFFD